MRRRSSSVVHLRPRSRHARLHSVRTSSKKGSWPCSVATPTFGPDREMRCSHRGSGSTRSQLGRKICEARSSWSTSGPTPASTACGPCHTFGAGLRVQRPGPGGHRRAHTRVRVREGHGQCAPGRTIARRDLPGRARQRLCDLAGVQQSGLASFLLHRRQWPHAAPGLRRGQLRPVGTIDSTIADRGSGFNVNALIAWSVLQCPAKFSVPTPGSRVTRLYTARVMKLNELCGWGGHWQVSAASVHEVDGGTVVPGEECGHRPNKPKVATRRLIRSVRGTRFGSG